jgi:hypothetical protein
MSELRRITERYLLEKQIASSEAASIFRGTDLESGATVAVELIHGNDGGAAEWRQQFLETARALRALDHPSLPRVLDFGITHAGGAFLVTEVLDGLQPSYRELREALRLVLFGEPGHLPAERPAPEMPSPPVALPPPPPTTPPRKGTEAPPLSGRRFLLGIGVPVAAILLVGITFGVVLLRLQSPEPLHEPIPTRTIARRAAAAARAAPPPPAALPSPSVAPAPTPPAPPPPIAASAPAPLATAPRAVRKSPPRVTRIARVGRATRAAQQRERTARALEAQADAEIAAGRFDAALDRLETLRRAWPERAGLVARTDHVAAERKTDQDLEDLLRTVAWYETLNQPLEGLRLLSGARPNPRYAQRFQETRQRLETQFVQLDRHPPGLLLGVDGIPLYEKGKAGTVHLRIADDFGVKSTEAWARSEGGPFVRVGIHHLFGSGYSLDVPPEVHRNQTVVEFYVTASDLSGHSGQLGSPEHPLKMMRKSWLERLLGMNERKEG